MTRQMIFTIVRTKGNTVNTQMNYIAFIEIVRLKLFSSLRYTTLRNIILLHCQIFTYHISLILTYVYLTCVDVQPKYEDQASQSAATI